MLKHQVISTLSSFASFQLGLIFPRHSENRHHIWHHPTKILPPSQDTRRNSKNIKTKKEINYSSFLKKPLRFHLLITAGMHSLSHAFKPSAGCAHVPFFSHPCIHTACSHALFSSGPMDYSILLASMHVATRMFFSYLARPANFFGMHLRPRYFFQLLAPN